MSFFSQYFEIYNFHPLFSLELFLSASFQFYRMCVEKIILNRLIKTNAIYNLALEFIVFMLFQFYQMRVEQSFCIGIYNITF